MVAVLDVVGSHGESLQGDDTAALENTIDDGRGEIVVVAGSSPVLEWLVGDEQHGASLNGASIDDVVEDVGGIGTIAEMTDFTADEDGGLDMGLEGGHEAALTRSSMRGRR